MSRYETISQKINACEKSLNAIGKEIWSKPEIKFEEYHAHKVLTDFLEQHGFSVQRSYILPTAFRAEFTTHTTNGTGPVVAVLCEYDALPGIGHACGHNLIAQCGVAAGLAIKTVLENEPTLPGKVVVMGTPGEEGGGGKILLLKGGAFKDVDVALMAHPSRSDFYTVHLNLCLPATVKYKGKSTHAAGSPWEGKNALDAAVSAYVNISLLRQQIKPEWRINVVITKGGEAPNVIPKDSELKLLLRTTNLQDMEDLKRKMHGCFQAAALSTDCQLEVEYHEDIYYKDLLQNKVLQDLYSKNARSFGIVMDESPSLRRVSTDQGNVSYELPALHPTFKISNVPNHSPEFTTIAGQPESQAKANVVAKALAMTGVDLFGDPMLLANVKRCFENVKPR